MSENKTKLLRGSFASYKQSDGVILCNLNQLAKKLLEWGEIPIKLNNTRAFELALLAEDYLKILKAKK